MATGTPYTDGLDDCTTTEEVEAWAAAEEKPYLDEMVAIDASIAALNDQKRSLHKSIDAIQADSAARRYELRAADAGPNQVLVPSGALSAGEIENLRRFVQQHDAQHP